jgi:hypothetical protein
MPKGSTELGTEYWQPSTTGPVIQTDLTGWAGLNPVTPPTIAAGGNWTSGVIYADGFRTLAAAVTSSQVGAISIQRYLDLAGLVPQGPAISAALVAATPQVVNVQDGVAFQSFTVKITNTSGSTANLSNFGLLMNSY